jgi:hypothetical protein
VDRNPIQRPGNHVPVKQKPIHSADTVQESDGYEEFDEFDDDWPLRMPSSARRYTQPAGVQTEGGRANRVSHTGRTGLTRADVRTLSSQSPQSSQSSRSNRGEDMKSRSTIPPRRTATQTSIPVVQPQRRAVRTDDIDEPAPRTEALRRSGQQRRLHWLVFVGGAMLIMVIGWMVLSMFASWWQVTLDDWHYGRPRTYQVDEVVGHNDSPSSPSHFIALNLNSHIEVIEFPGGDASKARVYIGPTLIGPGQDLAPVTLTFQDLTGNGKLDMIVNVGGSHFVFINDNGTFRPARPTDNIQL